MAFFQPPYKKLNTVLWVFLFGSCHIVAGEHFFTREIKAVVSETMYLECHEIGSRSSLELAAICVSQDSCLGMKTDTEWGASGMLCSCPNEPAWPGVTDLPFVPITHLRSQTYTTLPGKFDVIAEVFFKTFLTKCSAYLLSCGYLVD